VGIGVGTGPQTELVQHQVGGLQGALDPALGVGAGLAADVERHIVERLDDPRLIACSATCELSRTPRYYRKYGIEFFINNGVKDGDEIHVSLHLGNGVTPRLTAIYWTLDAVASAMEEAGLADLRWCIRGCPNRAGHSTVQRSGMIFCANCPTPFSIA
jgi:hypothetical protein